jgi:hypothetical protein
MATKIRSIIDLSKVQKKWTSLSNGEPNKSVLGYAEKAPLFSGSFPPSDKKFKAPKPILNFTGLDIRERELLTAETRMPTKVETKPLPPCAWEILTPTDVRIFAWHGHPIEALDLMASKYPLDFPHFAEVLAHQQEVWEKEALEAL